MSAVTSEFQSAYIRSGPEGAVDREATLHKRRKVAMKSLLNEFERDVAPHVEGQSEAIEHFKESCREKLNALTFLAIELLRMEPGEQINDEAVDLAGRLAFGDNGGPE